MNKEIFDLFIEQGFADCGTVAFDKVKIKPVQNAKNVIIAVMPYFYEKSENQNLCMYASLINYHTYITEKLIKIIKKLIKIYPDNFFNAYCDSSPIQEKKAAVIAEMGYFGKNQLFIHKKYGSFVFLGEIITDLDMETSNGEKIPCEMCGACVKACPSGAITENGFNLNLCISAITQKKDSLTMQEAELLQKNGSAWGCDHCQDCCPHNKNLPESEIAKTNRLENLYYEDIYKLNETEFQEKYKNRAFTWRGRDVLVRNLRLLEQSNL